MKYTSSFIYSLLVCRTSLNIQLLEFKVYLPVKKSVLFHVVVNLAVGCSQYFRIVCKV